MGWEAWFSLAVVALCVTTLAVTRFAADVVMVVGVTLLLLAGIVTPAEALSGLANEGMVTVGVLFVVVAGLRETGAIEWTIQRVLGRPSGLRDAQLRLMSPVATLSAFMNNTPVVAMFIPAVVDWARRHRLPLSRLMIPLSYASIAGGTCTLIGTSTNLVVNGLWIHETGQAGMGIFELAWVGLPLTLLLFVVILLFGNRLQRVVEVRKQAAEFHAVNLDQTFELDFNAQSLGFIEQMAAFGVAADPSLAASFGAAAVVQSSRVFSSSRQPLGATHGWLHRALPNPMVGPLYDKQHDGRRQVR